MLSFKTLGCFKVYQNVQLHQLLNLHGLSHGVIGIHSLFLGPIIKLGLGPDTTYRPEGAASVLVGLVPPYCLLLAGKLANGALLHFPCSFLSVLFAISPIRCSLLSRVPTTSRCSPKNGARNSFDSVIALTF